MLKRPVCDVCMCVRLSIKEACGVFDNVYGNSRCIFIDKYIDPTFEKGDGIRFWRSVKIVNLC